MRTPIKASDALAKCRETLCGITVTGPFNARALASVFDDLCMVEQYLRQQEGGAKGGNTQKDNTGNV